MTHEDGKTNEPPIADQLLAYLDENPQAQDTLEGIIWWLLERRVKFFTERVKEVLAELVDQGLVLERQGPDGQFHYRLNPRQRRQIRARIKRT